MELGCGPFHAFKSVCSSGTNASLWPSTWTQKTPHFDLIVWKQMRSTSANIRFQFFVSNHSKRRLSLTLPSSPNFPRAPSLEVLWVAHFPRRQQKPIKEAHSHPWRSKQRDGDAQTIPHPSMAQPNAPAKWHTEISLKATATLFFTKDLAYHSSDEENITVQQSENDDQQNQHM